MLLGGPRTIRQVQPPASPWPGLLAEDDDGRRCTLVDVGELTDVIAWRGAPSGHLAAVRDLVRTPAGHSALLPVCTQQVERFVAVRNSSGIPLSPGEVVTLAVSLVRGCTELGAIDAADAAGQWWLDDAGRPVLVGGGMQKGRDAAAALIRELNEECTDVLTDPLEHAAQVLADPRRTEHEAAGVEATLFEVAPAEALATAPLGPVRPRRVEAAALQEPSPRATRWWETWAPHVDATLPELASRALTGLWRRARADRPHRRAHPVASAAVVGALVVVGGLLWPRGAEDTALAEPRHPSPTATAAQPSATRATPRATDAGDSRTAEKRSAPGGSLADVARTLLARRAACADDACVVATQEDPRAEFTGEVEPAAARQVTLLDDYGGAAVLRADGAGKSSWLVVIVRRDGKWLLRDVRDAAEQPK